MTPTHEMESRPLRIGLLVLLAGMYLLAVGLFFRPVQLRVWNDFGILDLAIMGALILPFILVSWIGRPRHGVTRWARGIAALLALDVVFFAAGELGPLGTGHPSLESVASYFLAVAKPVLIPVALTLLGIACVRGERIAIVVTGFVCLAGETLYGSYPTAWWSTA